MPDTIDEILAAEWSAVEDAHGVGVVAHVATGTALAVCELTGIWPDDLARRLADRIAAEHNAVLGAADRDLWNLQDLIKSRQNLAEALAAQERGGTP